MNQESSLRADESFPQHHTEQAADDMQTQTAEEAEPMAVHFAVDCKLQFFSSSHKYQQISHRLNTFNVPQSVGQI